MEYLLTFGAAVGAGALIDRIRRAQNDALAEPDHRREIERIRENARLQMEKMDIQHAQEMAEINMNIAMINQNIQTIKMNNPTVVYEGTLPTAITDDRIKPRKTEPSNADQTKLN